MRSAARARLTVSIDTGRFTASGCSVSGNATVRRSGRTGSSAGSGGVDSTGTRVSVYQRASLFVYASQVDERQFFTEKPEQRPSRLQCPKCRRTNDYSIRWLRRTKKAQVPSGADARARAMFDKVKDYLIRVDADVVCTT